MMCTSQVDLFSRNSVPRRETLLDDDDDPDDDEPPQLYIGRHENQLYIQESILMQMQTEETLGEYNLNPTGSETAFPRVSWKPYLVSPSRTPYYNHDGSAFPLLTFDQRLKEAEPLDAMGGPETERLLEENIQLQNCL